MRWLKMQKTPILLLSRQVCSCVDVDMWFKNVFGLTLTAPTFMQTNVKSRKDLKMKRKETQSAPTAFLLRH